MLYQVTWVSDLHCEHEHYITEEREEEREEVTFGVGGPIGPTPQSVSNLTSFVGTIGRNKRFASLLYTNWHAIHRNSKNFMWRYVNTKFILRASSEKWAISQRNKKNKEQQKFPHRIGPVNFARVRAALRESKGTNEEPKRFEVFIATRTSCKRNLMREHKLQLKSSRVGKLLAKRRRKLSSPYLGNNNQAGLGATADPLPKLIYKGMLKFQPSSSSTKRRSQL
ncbi:hypothetical protein PIB30_058667 [Stylosanthes scabra]|uniref:Uncharacterized protein n=1 Tax=Stylosanthes scabra TaxID=79078 RepID=A0ABU6QLS0_9FABA|nr:hypothetical protein [Stylosanthes scabra]